MNTMIHMPQNPTEGPHMAQPEYSTVPLFDEDEPLNEIIRKLCL